MVHWKVAVAQRSPVSLVLGHDGWYCVGSMGFIAALFGLWVLGL